MSSKKKENRDHYKYDNHGKTLKSENDMLTKLEKQYMPHEARKKRVILFENEELIQEEGDLKKLLYLFNRGKDLEEISDEMEHLSTNEMVLMLLHLCMTGKIKQFALNWDM